MCETGSSVGRAMDSMVMVSGRTASSSILGDGVSFWGLEVVEGLFGQNGTCRHVVLVKSVASFVAVL